MSRWTTLGSAKVLRVLGCALCVAVVCLAALPARADDVFFTYSFGINIVAGSDTVLNSGGETVLTIQDLFSSNPLSPGLAAQINGDPAAPAFVQGLNLAPITTLTDLQFNTDAIQGTLPVNELSDHAGVLHTGVDASSFPPPAILADLTSLNPSIPVVGSSSNLLYLNVYSLTTDLPAGTTSFCDPDCTTIPSGDTGVIEDDVVVSVYSYDLVQQPPVSAPEPPTASLLLWSAAVLGLGSAFRRRLLQS